MHWGALIVEIAGVATVLAAIALLTPDSFDQPEGMLTVQYVIWTLRILRLLAQVLVIVFLTLLMSTHEGFADARLIYIALIIASVAAFVLDGVTTSNTAAMFKEMFANIATAALFASLVVLDLVAKPILLALGIRVILFACASVLDSFGLYELAQKNCRVAVRFVAVSVLLAFASLAAVLTFVLIAQGGGVPPSSLFAGSSAGSASWATMGWSVLVALVVGIALAYLVLWAASAQRVRHTHDALKELSS